MRTWLPLLLAMTVWAALPWAARPAVAAPDAARLAERAFRNPRSVAYSGTLSVTGAPGTAAATVRVTCDGKGREQREHLDGPARGMVVVTDGAHTWQRLPGQRTWTALPPAPPAASWDALRRNYEFRHDGQEKVAGRTAEIVAVNPRHPGNPRRVLWLDASNALVLRADSYSYAGALAVRSAYTALKLGRPATAPVPPPAGEVAAAPSDDRWEPCTSVADLARRLGRSVALPTRLPAGYTVAACYVRDCVRGGRLPVVRYTDGLNSLTLFVTTGQGQGQGPGRGRGFGYGRRMRGGRGACQMEQVDGQQVARLTQGGYTYVLVGDCRPEGLAAALQSIP